MNELTLDGKTYVSSKRAAEITGYAKDYIGQMCREGRVEARLVGRSWYVLESSLLDHRFGKEDEPKVAEAAAMDTWEAPLYTPEKREDITIVEKTSVSVFENVPAAPQTAPAARDSFYDLQSAWKDWFEHKAQTTSEAQPKEATVQDGVEVEEEIIETIEIAPRPVFEPAGPLPIEEEPVRVPIDRIQPYPVARHEEQEQGIEGDAAPEEDARPRRRHRRASSASSVVRAAVFIVCAVVIVGAIGAAFIGSGYGDSYLKGKFENLGITRYLSGIEVYEK